MTQIRIVFAGTPDFALVSLRALVEADQVPIAVLTQPDRPAGRGKKLTAGEVATDKTAFERRLKRYVRGGEPNGVGS